MVIDLESTKQDIDNFADQVENIDSDLIFESFLVKKFGTKNLVSIEEDDARSLLILINSRGRTKGVAYVAFLKFLSERTNLFKPFLLTIATKHMIKDIALLPILGIDAFNDKLDRIKTSIFGREIITPFDVNAILTGPPGILPAFLNSDFGHLRHERLLKNIDISNRILDQAKTESQHPENSSLDTLHLGLTSIFNKIFGDLNDKQRQMACFNVLKFSIFNKIDPLTNAILSKDVGYDYWDLNEGFAARLERELKKKTQLGAPIREALKESMPKIELILYQNKNRRNNLESDEDLAPANTQFTI